MAWAAAAAAGDFQINHLPDSWVVALMLIALLPFLGIALLVILGVGGATAVTVAVVSSRRAAATPSTPVGPPPSPRRQVDPRVWRYAAVGAAAAASIWVFVHWVGDLTYANERLHRYVRAGDAQSLKDYLEWCLTCGGELAHEKHPPFLMEALAQEASDPRAEVMRVLLSHGTALPETGAQWRAVLAASRPDVVSPLLQRAFMQQKVDAVRDAEVDLLIADRAREGDRSMLRALGDAGAKITAPGVRRAVLPPVLDRSFPDFDLYAELHVLGAGAADLPPLHAALFQLARDGSAGALKSLHPAQALLLDLQADPGFKRAPILLALLWSADAPTRQRVLAETGLDAAQVLQATPVSQRCELVPSIGKEAVLRSLPRGKEAKEARKACPALR